MTSVLTAVTHRLEAAFVRVLEGAADLTLVRRCADVAELLSAGAAGVARVAVVSPTCAASTATPCATSPATASGSRRWSATDDEEGERRLRQLGVADDPAPDDDAATVARALVTLAGATTRRAGRRHPVSRRRLGLDGTGADGGRWPDDVRRA